LVGIGLAVARLLAQGGATVVLAARSADKLKQLEREIPGSFAVPTDMRKQEDIRQLVQQTEQKFGRIDILISSRRWRQSISRITVRSWS
jgi:meso-butanediol dehydrogenase/(S,S)-butanediol dehydrogenase/diacetyl reductase